MSTIEIEKAVSDIICNVSMMDERPITRYEPLRDGEINLDSIDIMDVVFDIEAEFQLDVPDDDVAQWKTVGDVIDWVAGKIGAAQ